MREIILVYLIAVVSVFAETKVRFTHYTDVDEIMIDEHPTVKSVTRQVRMVAEGVYALPFPWKIDFLKRQHVPRRILHRAVLRVWRDMQKETPVDMERVHIARKNELLELLAVCAGEKDKAMFQDIYMDRENPAELRYEAYFAHLFSASDHELPLILSVITNRVCFLPKDRGRMYKALGMAYSFSSEERRKGFAEPFRRVAWSEDDIWYYPECDNLMKAFDPDYARSLDRIKLIEHFLSQFHVGSDHPDRLLPLSKALDECTNQTVKVEAPWFVFLDAYSPFVSYEESILGEKPNPYRSAIRIAAGSVCVIGLLAGIWVWIRRKRMSAVIH